MLKSPIAYVRFQYDLQHFSSHSPQIIVLSFYISWQLSLILRNFWNIWDKTFLGLHDRQSRGRFAIRSYHACSALSCGPSNTDCFVVNCVQGINMDQEQIILSLLGLWIHRLWCTFLVLDHLISQHLSVKAFICSYSCVPS